MMASRRRISKAVQHQVRERAHGLCEYCHTIEKWQYERFTIDHIVSLAQGGTDDSENLALACFHCNRRKSDRATGIDPESGLAFDIFNPRREQWNEHFIWSADRTEIIGLTATGHATIAQLELNRPRILNIRLADVSVGRHPPQNDSVMQKYNPVTD
jgi:hypothetical protein